jgi:large subunit ribosomal protein L21e
MVNKSHGLFAGRTRYLSKKHNPSRLGLTKRIKSFDIGAKVVVLPKGNKRDIPHPRYKGKTGVVIEKRGGAYVVEVAVSKSMKRKLIVPQMHLEAA